jgi:hypothetical protein
MAAEIGPGRELIEAGSGELAMARAVTRRRPPLYVVDALTHLAVAGDRRLARSQFEMLMGRTWSRAIAVRALDAMLRRGWIILQSGMIHVPDAGQDAARNGISFTTSAKRQMGKARNRVAATRMPRGLF